MFSRPVQLTLLPDELTFHELIPHHQRDGLDASQSLLRDANSMTGLAASTEAGFDRGLDASSTMGATTIQFYRPDYLVAAEPTKLLNSAQQLNHGCHPQRHEECREMYCRPADRAKDLTADDPNEHQRNGQS